MGALEKIQPGIRALETYSVSGKPFHDSLVKLNQNENPFDLPTELKEEIMTEFLRRPWNRYPEVFPLDLIAALAEFTKHQESGIIVGHGSNELMYTVLMSIVGPGKKVLLPIPTFFLYEKIVRILNGEVVTVLAKPDLSFDVEKIIAQTKQTNPSLIILVSPNSPTAQSLSLIDVERIINAGEALVLVDEAYIDFSDQPSVQSLLARYNRLVILRTFSKSFSLAGLRIGYLLAEPELTAELLKPKIPFTVDGFSALAAMTMIRHSDRIEQRLREIKQLKKRFGDQLMSMNGVRTFPSDTNFFVFRTSLDAKTLFQRLLDRDVLIRDVSSYPLMTKMLRVNVGTSIENEEFLSVLRNSL